MPPGACAWPVFFLMVGDTMLRAARVRMSGPGRLISGQPDICTIVISQAGATFI